MKKKLKHLFLAACVGLAGMLGMFVLWNPTGSEKAVATDGVEQKAVPITGWVQESDGRWWYRYADGSYPVNTWKAIRGNWYFFDVHGWMQTGWIQSGGSWYYLDGSGAMKTGWLKEGMFWYYLDRGGTMRTGWLKEGASWYYLDGNGAMRTKWLQWKDHWYYLASSGAMQMGWILEDGNWYYLDGNGAMQTGWLQWQGGWYYLASSGVMQTGWITSGQFSYYLDKKSGKMLADTITPTGHYVYPDGHRSKEEQDITYRKTDTVAGKSYYRKYYKKIATEDTAVMEETGRVTERENKITLELLKKIKFDQGEKLLLQLDQKNKEEGFEKVGEAYIAFDWSYHTFDVPVYGVLYEKTEENEEQGYGGKHYVRIYSLETGKLCAEYGEGLK